MLVYVLNADGYPLIPSSRCAHIRHLLKSGRAKVVRQKPFTIQLCYETTNYTQPLCGGTDPGRTNIGEAVLDSKGNVLYSAHVETRNKEIPKLMEERKAHRQASRRICRLDAVWRILHCDAVLRRLSNLFTGIEKGLRPGDNLISPGGGTPPPGV